MSVRQVNNHIKTCVETQNANFKTQITKTKHRISVTPLFDFQRTQSSQYMPFLFMGHPQSKSKTADYDFLFSAMNLPFNA